MTEAKLFFPSLVRLSKDRGPIGEVLRSVPDWAVREADRIADQTMIHSESRETPGRPFARDPWQLLIEAPAASETQRSVFRAAQSQIVAVRHVVALGLGRATLNTDWYAEILKAEAKGDKRRAEHAKRKLADAMAGYSEVQKHVREQAEDRSDLLEQMQTFLTRRRAKLIRHGERDQARPKYFPTWSEVRRNFRLETMLVEWWVRIDNHGLPGLMFWSNAAMTKLLLALTGKRFANLGRDYIKKLRQRLGLVAVGKTAHFVWDISIRHAGNGWEIKGFQRTRKNLVCHGILQFRPFG